MVVGYPCERIARLHERQWIIVLFFFVKNEHVVKFNFGKLLSLGPITNCVVRMRSIFPKNNVNQ